MLLSVFCLTWGCMEWTDRTRRHTWAGSTQLERTQWTSLLISQAGETGWNPVEAAKWPGPRKAVLAYENLVGSYLEVVMPKRFGKSPKGRPQSRWCALELSLPYLMQVEALGA
jgi:hypothetical protein